MCVKRSMCVRREEERRMCVCECGVCVWCVCVVCVKGEGTMWRRGVCE